MPMFFGLFLKNAFYFLVCGLFSGRPGRQKCIWPELSFLSDLKWPLKVSYGFQGWRTVSRNCWTFLAKKKIQKKNFELKIISDFTDLTFLFGFIVRTLYVSTALKSYPPYLAWQHSCWLAFQHVSISGKWKCQFLSDLDSSTILESESKSGFNENNGMLFK